MPARPSDKATFVGGRSLRKVKKVKGYDVDFVMSTGEKLSGG
jgi:hypothetical protein